MTSESRRRVLLVSYWFPPAVGAAAERMEAFAKYLPEFGWDVEVLTARGRSDAATEIGGVAIHRIRDPLGDIRRLIPEYDPRRAARRRRLRVSDLLFPDRFVFWQRSAHRFGIKLMRSKPFDVILASFPPASAVQLGLGLARDTGVPMVLDVRDKWIGPGGYEPRTDRARKRLEALEWEAVESARVVVTVSEPLAVDMAARTRKDMGRFAPIPNGFERMEAPPATPTRPPGRRLVVAHVGTVIPRNRPDLFFDSLARAAQSGSWPTDSIEFRFVGNLSQDYVRTVWPDGEVTTTGLVSRESARGEIFAADALLLLTGAYVGQWGHNAKIFEYLQSDRPIMCLEEKPGSNDATLLRSIAPGRSFFAPLGDADKLASAIRDVRNYVEQAASSDCGPGGGPTDASRLGAFDRRRLTGLLAPCLARSASDKRNSRP